MKKYSILSIILFASLIFCEAQSILTIGAGVKLIKPDSRNMTLWYVDESPSRDNIYTDFKQSGNIAIQLNLRLQDNNVNKKGHVFFDGQLYFGALNGGTLGLGIFYANYDKRKFRIVPELSGMMGYCSKKIGVMENNDIYIQVNKTKFKDYTNVDVSLANFYIGLKPGINLTFPVGVKSEFGVGVNYQLSAKSGSVNFSGVDNSGTAVSDSEGLKESNVGFYVAGIKTDIIPFNPNGFELKIFYGF